MINPKSFCKTAMACFAGLIVACVPVSGDFWYIRLLAAPGLSVSAPEMLDIDNVVLAEAIPRKYILQKDSYVLTFVVPTSTSMPAMRISVDSEAGARHVSMTPGGNRGGNATYSRAGLASESEVEFIWISDARNRLDEQVMELDVYDKDHRLLGRERIFFEFKINGTYRVIDAL